MTANMKKILDLQKALEAIGIKTELNTEAKWYCADDHKTHYGIELFTDMDYGEDTWSFIFTPDGEYITDCTDAPTKQRYS